MIRDSLERLNFIATDRDGMTRKRNRDRTPTVAAPTDVNIILLSSPPSRNILLSTERYTRIRTRYIQTVSARQTVDVRGP